MRFNVQGDKVVGEGEEGKAGWVFGCLLCWLIWCSYRGACFSHFYIVLQNSNIHYRHHESINYSEGDRGRDRQFARDYSPYHGHGPRHDSVNHGPGRNNPFYYHGAEPSQYATIPRRCEVIQNESACQYARLPERDDDECERNVQTTVTLQPQSWHKHVHDMARDMPDVPFNQRSYKDMLLAQVSWVISSCKDLSSFLRFYLRQLLDSP